MDILFIALVAGFSSYPAGSSPCWKGYRGIPMNLMHAIGGLVSLVLLIYLMVALLKPEWF